jgi:hypothetical protein
VSARVTRDFQTMILRGEDPLGAAFARLRSREERRQLGATYTPLPLVQAMLGWAERAVPVRVVDPGAGSGRFLVAAGRRFPGAKLVGVEVDPLASLLLRANLHVLGLASRSSVVGADYRELELPEIRGSTLFLGNPPYVRHHAITARWKAWLAAKASDLRVPARRLAGLHAHFYLATALLARPGDRGVFVTAAEWLDVNYGALVRELFLGSLGGQAVHLLEPVAKVFPDADTTAAVACFEVGTRAKTVRLCRVASIAGLGDLAGGRSVRRERLEAASRWTPLTRARSRAERGLVELGDLCRVHRGQVTGANRIWITGGAPEELPSSVLFRSITRAKELFSAGAVLSHDAHLKCVIDLPIDLDVFDPGERRLIERFLVKARRLGADQGFIAQHRRAWWSVGLREPAPILATYMARRPPAFVRNLAEARHLNVAHGLYPREPLPERVLDALAHYLTRTTRISAGRTYAGGLTKFEPGEMERLLVPAPDSLARLAP